MKAITSLIAFLCAFLPGGEGTLWAQDSVVLEHTITDGVELCTVIDPSDDIYGLDDDGHPLGLGTGWTDVARGYPDFRTARSLAFQVPGVNPDGAGQWLADHPGDPERLMIRLTIKERRWVMWENLSDQQIDGFFLLTTRNNYQLRRKPNPANPSYEIGSINYAFQSGWTQSWQPWGLAPFDGVLDGDGPSGWHFSCGKLEEWPHMSEWCQPGNWDYHTVSTVVFLDWADLSIHDKDSWRSGHTERLDYMTTQYVNYDPWGPPAGGPALGATSHHGWAIAWGNRPTVDVRIVALD